MKTRPVGTMGARLLLLRENSRMTQVTLARKIGVAQSVISDMEHDTYKKPSASLIAALADALCSTPEWILTGHGEELATTRLSDNEHALLKVFRILDAKDQARILAAAQAFGSLGQMPERVTK